MAHSLDRYYAREKYTPQTFERAPAWWLSKTGGVAEAESYANIGRGMQQAGSQLAAIEAEKQRNRDNVTLAEMKGQLDDFEYTSTPPDPAQITDINEFKKAEEKYEKDWRKRTKELSKDKSRQVTDKFKEYTALHWDRARRDYHGKTWPMEKDYAIAKLNGLWSEKFKKYVNDPARLKVELKGLMEQFGPYLKPTDIQKMEAGLDEQIAEYQKQDALVKLHEAAKAMPYTEAITYLNDVEGIDKADRNDLIKRRERQNDIETAVTNEPIRSELHTMALDIWRGAVSKEEFDKALDSAAYGEEQEDGSIKYIVGDTVSDKPLIDDAAYRELSKTAATTLKSTQAESLNRADTEAGRLIVDYREEDAFARYISDTMKGLEPDIAKLFESEANEKRKLQFWFLSRHNQELRDWITEHPEKVGKDFYQYSEQLKHQYWNATIEEIKKRKIERFKKIRRGGNLRLDGTQKGAGFLGVLTLPDGSSTSEYSVQSNAVKVNGKRIDFPSLVPTLTQEEIKRMTDDIIPNRKSIPEPIMQKAIAHAKKRIKQGKSVFAEGALEAGGPPTIKTRAEYDALSSGTVYIAPDGSKRTKK
jgi:hypothetical protein